MGYFLWIWIFIIYIIYLHNFLSFNSLNSSKYSYICDKLSHMWFEFLYPYNQCFSSITYCINRNLLWVLYCCNWSPYISNGEKINNNSSDWFYYIYLYFMNDLMLNKCDIWSNITNNMKQKSVQVTILFSI